MSFSTEKEKPNSERFMLVKLTPARYISEDMADEGSGVYSIDWTFPIEKVQRNGVDLTETTSTPGTNDQWYWDGESLEIKLAAAPSSSNVIVVFYNLFYTSGQYRITTADPEDPQTDEIHWEPRLEEEPAVKQSVKDIISGTLSTAITSIRLINADNDFQQYLTDNDSFYEKTVKCWLCINGVDNIQKAFEGRVKKVNITKSRVTLTLYDIFSLLDQPALMGDPPEKAYWIRQAGSFPNMQADKSGRPIPLILSGLSRHATAFHANILDGSGNDTGLDARIMSDGLEAVCTNFTVASTTTNRVWGLCRTLNGIKTRATGTFEAASSHTFDRRFLRFSSHDYEVGETFSWTHSGTTYYRTVVLVGDFVVDGTSYNMAITSTGSETLTTSSTINPQKAIAVSITSYDENDYFVTSDEFTLSETTLSSGNKYHYLTFDNNFESGTVFISTLDPIKHRVVFRIAADGDLGHGAVLKGISENAGLTTNAASFAAADSALDADVSFQIPQFDEQDFASYRKYAELICQSTMGILHANNNFELEYQLLATPSSSNAITEDRYLKDSLAIDIDYQDIVTQLIAYNPHNSSEAAIDAASSPSETVSSSVAEYLHGVKNTVRFRHVLETITDRIQDIFDILSQRRAIYSFSTSTDNLDSEIGDDLQLESPQLLGGESAKDLKIISLDKSADRVDVEATDLLDI